MMYIDFKSLRHGESVANEVNRLIATNQYDLIPKKFFSLDDKDYYLTKLGHNQARKISGEIATIVGIHEVLIISSPYLRARQTTDHVVKSLASKQSVVVHDSRLIERDFGKVNEYRQDPDRRPLIGQEFMRSFRDPAFVPFENGETFLQVTDRVWESYSDWLDYAREKRIRYLVFSVHGEVSRSLRITKSGQYPTIDLDFLGAKLKNCQLDHYSHRDPQTGKLTAAEYSRSICLHDPTAGCDWRPLL